jgi:hypothetical protein
MPELRSTSNLEVGKDSGTKEIYLLPFEPGSARRSERAMRFM